MRIPTMLRLLPVGIVALALGACGGRAGPALPALPSLSDPLLQSHRDASGGKIKHIVIVVQENRSFNNLFYGFPGAHTVSYGYDTHGKRIELKPIGFDTTWDIDHSFAGFLAACDGTGSYPGTGCKMDGFDNEYAGCGHRAEPKCPHPDPAYSYVPRSETKPYFYLGKHYVLADEMYASNVDASSFISHQYIIAGQAESGINYPTNWWGCVGEGSDFISTITKEREYGKPIPICWDDKTIGDEMDKARLSWAYYASLWYGDGGIWSAYQNVKHIYFGPDWQKDVISPPTDFFSDVKHGKLRRLTWITPTWENSDHAGGASKTGPSWVASLVNAIGESKYWNSTAIFIFWDDYGGWYDPKPPPLADYDGLGLRLPMLIVSPYAKQGKIDHTQYEHGSILKFVEDTFGLGRLAASDKRATSPLDAFDFTQAPRKFTKVPSEHDINWFERIQPPDHHIPDAE
ncbi:MAG: alkaline phosphatase family protein [Candidatus Cybelea sp.]